MMFKNVFFFGIYLLTNLVYGNNFTESDSIEHKLSIYLKSGEYTSAIYYLKTFPSSQSYPAYWNYYYLSLCYLKTDNIDSSLIYLHEYIIHTCDKLNFRILVDPRFIELHDNPGWDDLKQEFLKCKVLAYSGTDSLAVSMLMEMYVHDQLYREIRHDIKQDSSRRKDYNVLDSLYNLAIIHDSLARAKFNQYIKLYGWPGKHTPNRTYILFFLTLVVQHSPVEIHERYISFMRKAFRQKGIAGPTWASYYDRYMIHKGKKVKYTIPLLYDKPSNTYVLDYAQARNPKNIDKRRRKLGLDPFTKSYVY